MKRDTMSGRTSWKGLICLLPCLISPALFAQDQPAYPDQGSYEDQGADQGQQTANPPSIAARISSLQGNASFQPAGRNDWAQPNSTTR